MRKPPECVALQARYHWLMCGTILLGAAGLYLAASGSPLLVVSAKGYVITFSLAGLYGLTGTLMWFGLQPAPFLNQICSLPYLTRPRMGARVWEDMKSEEYRAHFK